MTAYLSAGPAASVDGANLLTVQSSRGIRNTKGQNWIWIPRCADADADADAALRLRGLDSALAEVRTIGAAQLRLSGGMRR